MALQARAQFIERRPLGDLANLTEQVIVSDMPASAARDLSRRCSASGTLRIWIIAVMW